VASIVGSPHESVEAVPSRASFIETSNPLIKPWAQTGLQILDLRDGALRAGTTIKTSAKGTGVGRAGVVVGEINYLECATFVRRVV
jgi:hypothetical protein